MSGMFYSLDEAAEKLNKSKDELKQLVKDGQIREFRDGPNILFKAEEVEALILTGDVSGPTEVEAPIELHDETEIIEMAPEELEPEIGTEVMEIPELALEESEPQADENELEIPELALEEPEVKIEDELEIPELALEETEEKAADETEIPELALEESEPEVIEDEMEIPELAMEESATPEDSLTLAPEPEKMEADEDDFIDFNADTAIVEVPQESEEVSAGDSLDDFLLAPETGAPADINDLSGLSDGDTALVGQGTSVLGLSDNKDFDITDDTMADTVILDGTKAGSDGLDDLDDEVSLDSFGSGSGLLDLSLQADDTSLGGILDEIYTDDNPEPALAEPQEPDINAGIGAESDAPAGIGDELMPQIAASPAMAIGVGMPQAAPDSQSNILGMLLFVPGVAILYAAIVTLGGIRGISTSILTAVQDFVWFIFGGLGAITVIIAVATIMLTGEKNPTVRKAKKAKVKKEKAPKVKKEKVKKPKKEKKPKPPKVKKAKK